MNSSKAKRPLILVVDDSPVMRRSVQLSLELGGYDVACAASGLEAVGLLDEGLEPALVLTDIVMPGMSGVELIAHARRRLRFTPIVALTTQQGRALRDEGKEAGATAWALKPTGGNDLLRLVARFVPPVAA